MKSFIIRLLGLKGSWKWAVKQMKIGHVMYVTTDTGAAKYKLDDLENGRIVWAFIRELKKDIKWDSANIFMKDFACTSWDIWVSASVINKDHE